MAKPYPVHITLKPRKCPTCKDHFHHELQPQDIAVLAACKTEKCDFNLELFWIGDNDSWSN